MPGRKNHSQEEYSHPAAGVARPVQGGRPPGPGGTLPGASVAPPGAGVALPGASVALPGAIHRISVIVSTSLGFVEDIPGHTIRDHDSNPREVVVIKGEASLAAASEPTSLTVAMAAIRSPFFFWRAP